MFASGKESATGAGTTKFNFFKFSVNESIVPVFRGDECEYVLEKFLNLKTDLLADKTEDVTPIDFNLRCLYMHQFATKDSL